MKFSIHSKDSWLFSKLKEDGEEVSYYSDGISSLDKAKDVIIFETIGHGKIAEALRTAGYNVLFASKFADRLEQDKKHANSVAESAGITTINNSVFRDSDSATPFINTITEMWFQHGEPVFPCNGTIIVNTPYSNTSVFWNYPEKEPRLYGQLFKKLLILFKAAKYTGPCGIECQINKEDKKVYFIGFIPRIRQNAFKAFTGLLGMPLSEFLTELVFGNIEEISVNIKDFGYSLLLTAPQEYSSITDSLEKVPGQSHLEDGSRRASMDYQWMNENRFISSGGEVSHAKILTTAN